MNQLFLHRLKDGRSTPVSSIEPHVSFRDFRISAGVFQWLKIEAGEETRIRWNTDRNTITLVCSLEGFLLFQSGSLQPHLIAQSQCTLEYAPEPADFELILKLPGIKKYSVFVLTAVVVPGLEELLKKISALGRPEQAFTPTIEIQKLISGILTELEKIKPSVSQLEAHQKLLLLAAADASQRQEFGRGDDTDKAGEEKKQIFLLAESIVLSMDEPWSIRKLADQGRLSPGRFKSLFRKYIGQPAAAFRIRVRLEKAMQLLLNEQMSIQEISASVGYSNPGQFASMFRSKMGCSPSQFRKSVRMGEDSIAPPVRESVQNGGEKQ